MNNSSKRIVCLAKSIKTGGFCFAGKEISNNNVIGRWIRPVSSRETEEISLNECKYENGYKPDLLDIIELPIIKHKPTGHQCENYLIDSKSSWSKKDFFNKEILAQLCDNPIILWEINNSSSYGYNDRVHESLKDDLEPSLYLITPSSLTINVQTEFGEPKVRALFKYNDEFYRFSITEPDIRERYSKREYGEYPINAPDGKIYLCVSIGLPYNDGYCYKFVASIIE